MSKRLFVIADIGGPSHYHLGDEAMLEANLQRFRQLVPNIEFTVLSGDPVWTSNRYGVQALRTPVFRSGRQEIGDPAQWLGDEISKAVRDSDGVVISGGGNLCQTWPEKILERVALIQYARELGRPVVVVGQTLGPDLTVHQRRLLAEALPWSSWLGVREESSADLARALGVTSDRVHQQLDDAFFLEALPVEDERAAPFRGERLWIMITLDASFGGAERERQLLAIAGQLDALADRLNAELLFVPHVGGTDLPAALADDVAGKALSARLRAPLLILDLWQPREVRWLAAQAAMVVSTRYHPLVFATAAGVAPLGIYTDAYTRRKLRGALAHGGLEGYCLSAADAERGAFLPLALELWRQRQLVQRRLAPLREQAWPLEQQRWDHICRALRLEPEGSVAPPRDSERAPATVDIDKRQQPLPDFPGDDQWRQYEQHGYLRLGRVLDDGQLLALRERMDQIMLGRVRYPTLQMQLDTGGAYEDLPQAVAGLPEITLAYRKVQGLEIDPMALDLIRHDLFREICARHYGRHASVSIFRAMLMNKPAGNGTYLPWHQDGGDVWKLDRDPLVTVWIALDPATRTNGCLQVIPGSHRLGVLSKYGSTISAEHARIHCPDDAITYLEVQAGEAILVHNWLLHRSDVNRTDKPRRAMTACYMDGRTLNALTGNRFPIVFGVNEEAEDALPFLHVLREENRQLQGMVAEAQRYAQSLIQDNRDRDRMRAEAERYAQSLVQENQNRDRMRAEAERYAQSLLEHIGVREQMCNEAKRYAESLEAELARVRTALGSTEAGGSSEAP